MANINKWLIVYQTKSWTLPLPDIKTININASGTILWYQWYAWTMVLSIAGMSAGWWKDPVDWTYYTYMINASKTKMQILWYLENSNKLSLDYNPLISSENVNAEPASYIARTVYTRWDQLGILLSSDTLLPAQTNYDSTSFTWIDVTISSTWAYKAYITSTEIISGTWKVFTEIAWRLDDITYYPGWCNLPNIRLANSQVWAACNVWANTAYNGSNWGVWNATWALGSPTRWWDDNVNWKHFQWWRTKWFYTTDTSQEPNQLTSNPNANDTYNYIWNASLSRSDWIQNQTDDLWGWSLSDTGTLDAQKDKKLRQWPCPSGWHVPSAKDWIDACNSILNTTCTGMTADTTFRTTLMLPLAGYRDWSSGRYNNQGMHWFYWSSSPDVNSRAYRTYFTNSVLIPAGWWGYRAYAESVRCIKD